MTDLLVVSIVAGVCRNPLVRDAYSVTDGLSMVAVVLAWGYALDWLSYRVPAIHKLLHPEPVVLIEGGRVAAREPPARTRDRESAPVPAPPEGGVVALAGRRSPAGGERQDQRPPRQGEARTPAGRRRTATPATACIGTAEADGHAEPSTSHEDPDVADFVRAADRLREKIADHERHIADHRAAVAELKGMLAGTRRPLEGPRGEATESHRGPSE